MGQINTVLADIKDERSADAARPKLKEAALHMLKLRKQAKELKQPTKAEKDLLDKRYNRLRQRAGSETPPRVNRMKGIPGGPEAVQEIAVVGEKKKKQ